MMWQSRKRLLTTHDRYREYENDICNGVRQVDVHHFLGLRVCQMM